MCILTLVYSFVNIFFCPTTVMFASTYLAHCNDTYNLLRGQLDDLRLGELFNTSCILIRLGIEFHTIFGRVVL